MKPGRRVFLGTAAALLANRALGAPAPAARTPTIDVRKLGAFGDGRRPDLQVVREAMRMAAAQRGGATVYFAPGEYFLGAADATVLVDAKALRNVRIVGERAVLACRSVEGQSSMLTLSGCQGTTVEGLRFRDHGANRNIDWLGAAAINLATDGARGCENIEIRDCTFDSVLTAVLSREDGEGGRCRDIRLQNLSISKSYYGLNFQNNGDHVTARNLRFDDVKRSYFPYGVTDHDVELETLNNATGYTDVLIKCYTRETARLRVKVYCRNKRGGDAIVGIDQQHAGGRGVIRDLTIELDVAEADCGLDAVVMMRAFDSRAQFQRSTSNRWDRISIDGNVHICEKTKLFEVPTVARTPGTLTIGPRLAAHRRLPASIPGFVVTRART